MDYNKPGRGRKPRAPKRPRKTQGDEDETTPKRRTRATTMSEILHPTAMYAASSQASYSNPQSSPTTSRAVTSCAYSPQQHFTAFRMRPRVVQSVQTSSSYFQQSQLQQMPTSSTMSESNQAAGAYHTTSTDVPRPQLPHLSATAIILERNTAPGIPEDQISSGCSTQQMPEVPAYHAMAERTRAARKLLENRSRYATTPDLSIHSIPQQSSGAPYNTRRAVHNISISTATTVKKYWSNDTTRIFLTRQNLPQNITLSKETKDKGVQTNITITEEEAKLLKILRIKHLDPSRWHINIEDDDYTVTYNQPQEKEETLNSFNNIVRSSDLIKSSLINFYNNAIQQNNLPEISTSVTESQHNYGSNTNADNRGQTNSLPPPDMQNKNVTRNPHLLQALLSNRGRRVENMPLTNNNTTFTQSEVRQTKRSEYFQIPTMAGNQEFNSYTNTRHYEGCQHRPRGMQGHQKPNHNSHSDFLRFAQFMDPLFLPPGIRQTFEQYGMPRWF